MACQRFLVWERDFILRDNPSEQDKNEHRTALKWLLRLSKLFHASTTDPDFPDHSAADMMELTVWKLEQSWKMIYEPMPVAEAEKLLAEIFPDERPVAGAHGRPRCGQTLPDLA